MNLFFNTKTFNLVFRCCRNYSSKISQQIFDYEAKQQQRFRAAINAEKVGVSTYDYIKEEVGWRLADRIFDIKRTFTTGLEISAGRGYVSRHLDDEAVDFLLLCDPVKEMLAQRTSPENIVKGHSDLIINHDKNFRMLRDGSLDLVVSCLSMHWVNDLNAAFSDCLRVLRQDGVFIGAMFCSDTLFELRSSLQEAETKMRNSFTARVSPFVRPEDVAMLLHRAGYNLITLDCDEFRVGYPSAIELMRDLKGMGEQNCSFSRQLNLNRSLLEKTKEIYKEMYSENEDGSVPATYQIVYWIGWKPDPSQPKPAARGSANFSLKDLDKLADMAPPLSPVKS